MTRATLIFNARLLDEAMDTPGALLIVDSKIRAVFQGYFTSVNKVDSSTGITSQGTDAEYPTVKAVYDYVPQILYGNSDPNNNDGRDGDIYLKLV